MITPANRATPPAPVDRGALQESEKKAAEQQPDSFNEKALTDKIVEIAPVDATDTPIRGLDPKPAPSSKP